MSKRHWRWLAATALLCGPSVAVAQQGTGPAGSTSAGQTASPGPRTSDVTRNGSNASVGNSSPHAADQGWPHATEHRKQPKDDPAAGKYESERRRE